MREEPLCFSCQESNRFRLVPFSLEIGGYISPPGAWCCVIDEECARRGPGAMRGADRGRQGSGRADHPSSFGDCLHAPLPPLPPLAPATFHSESDLWGPQHICRETVGPFTCYFGSFEFVAWSKLFLSFRKQYRQHSGLSGINGRANESGSLGALVSVRYYTYVWSARSMNGLSPLCRKTPASPLLAAASRVRNKLGAIGGKRATCPIPPSAAGATPLRPSRPSWPASKAPSLC